MNINDEYFLVVRNQRNDTVDVDQKCDTTFWKESNLIKPIHYSIDEEYWSGDDPRDIIYGGAEGILIKDYLKEEFFFKFNPNRIKLQPAYITSPDEEKFFEGYWVAMVNDAPNEWLDVENSVMDYDPDSDPNDKEYWGVYEYQLNTEILKEIPLDDRLFFKLPYKYGRTHQIIHRSLVEYMGKIPSEKRDMAFIPIGVAHKRMLVDDDYFEKNAI
jgi:hypothetical protein